MSLIDQVKQQLGNLDKDQIRERLLKLETQRATQQARQKERNANLSEEDKAKRAAAHKAYREKNPDKFKAQREAYNAKPEVKERRKEYQRKRNAELKALRELAKEMGIEVPKAAVETTSAPANG